jgi:hypothetical protein
MILLNWRSIVGNIDAGCHPGAACDAGLRLYCHNTVEILRLAVQVVYQVVQFRIVFDTGRASQAGKIMVSGLFWPADIF